MSLGKSFVDWLDEMGENVLAFRVHCGAGCETLYSLDIASGDLRPLVNAWGEPNAPYADIFATVYLFSPDQRWLAATSWGRGLPEAMVLEWPGPAEPLDLSARLDTHYTEAQSWAGSSLVFVAYPPGDPDTWGLPPRPDLYVWEADTGAIRHVASGAFRAVFAPSGDRLAALFVGEPRVNEEGRIESEGSTPHLGLLRWPEGELPAGHLVSTKGVSNAFDLWRLPTPIWSPQGRALAFQPAGGGLALMGRDGDMWPVLTGKVVSWIGWGAGGNLALLVGEQIWLVRGLVRVPDVGPTLSTPNDLESAREALTAFFSLLHAQRYSEATNYYGGTYDILRDWNPDVDGDDYATLSKRGCTGNGLRCLRINTIVREEQVSPAEFRFIVEFMNDDGTLFTRGPCCGANETEMPPQTQFTFTAKKVDNRFLVQDLPVYVP